MPSHIDVNAISACTTQSLLTDYRCYVNKELLYDIQEHPDEMHDVLLLLA